MFSGLYDRNAIVDAWIGRRISHKHRNFIKSSLLLAHYSRHDGSAYFQSDFLHFFQHLLQKWIPWLLIQTKVIVDFVELLRREIIDIEPIVIPRVCLGLLHLRLKFLICYLREARKGDVITAFDDRLTLAKNSEIARNAIPQSKLLGGANDIQVLAIPYEDAGLTSPDEDVAKLALIYVDAGSGVKEEDIAFFAV